MRVWTKVQSVDSLCKKCCVGGVWPHCYGWGVLQLACLANSLLAD